MLECAALLIFPALMAYAAASDLLTMTISNRVSIVLVMAFLSLAMVAGLGWFEIVIDHLACGACVLVLTFALFAAGWIGGGDAKIAAATVVWIGWENLADYGVSASTFGGAVTLAIIVFRKLPLPRLVSGAAWAERLHEAQNGVPYGIALAAAGLVIYPETSFWSAMAGA